MDVESDGSSEALDSWSFVESNFKENCGLACSDSGVLTQYSSSSSVGIEECFELTELNSVDQACSRPISTKENLNPTESVIPDAVAEVDTDGISVISDDPEDFAARDLDDTVRSITPIKERGPDLLNTAHPGETPLTTTGNSNEVEGWSLIHSRTTIVAMVVCISLIGILIELVPSGGDKNVVKEIIVALDKLKAENDALRLQMHDLALAYSRLEKKLDTSQLKKNGVAAPRVIDAPVEMLKNIEVYARETSNANLMKSTQTLLTIFSARPFVADGDVTDLVKKLELIGLKILTQSNEKDLLQQRFCFIAARVSSKMFENRKSDDKLDTSDLNIVQWYPTEEENIIVGDSESNSERNISSTAERIPEVNQTKDSIEKERSAADSKSRDHCKSGKRKEDRKKQLRNDKMNDSLRKDNRLNISSNDTASSKWYHMRNKGREAFRKENKRSEWQFERAKDRRHQRNEDGGTKEDWQFRSFESRR